MNTEDLNVPRLCCQSATRVFRGMDVMGLKPLQNREDVDSEGGASS